MQVYRIVPEDDDLFLILEYVDGVSLWDDLRARAVEGRVLPLDQAMSILKDILSGLAFAHAQGICHRDLKPANILLTKSRIPKIADLGIARVLGNVSDNESSGSSRSQGGTGTPDFMSPEQARGEDADFTSDLFMTGIIGYLLLSGRHPFAHPSGLFQICELLRDDGFLPPPLTPPNSVASSEARLFREYAAIVMRLLERERTSRFGSAKEANQAIAAVSPFLDCPHCGSRVPESNRFCGQCGERIPGRQQPPPQNLTQPETARDLSDEGYRLSRQQRWDDAIHLYRRAIDLDGSFQRTFWNLAYALNHVGEYQEAIDIATQGLGLQQSEARHTANLLNVRAFSYGRLKRYDEAIIDLTEAIVLDPESTEHLSSRARVYAYSGDINAAITDAEEVLTKNPEHAGALRLLAELGT